MERRRFFQALTASAMSLPGVLRGQQVRDYVSGEPAAGPLPRRPLGRTGENLSIIGLGGLVLAEETQETANNLVAEAIDQRVNYLDVAPSYGNAEDRMGPALKPFRKDVFLACKTLKRDKAGAAEELERSLGKLQTDHFDLYQLHALSSKEDVEQALGPGGALETFVKARQDGKIRFIGFSAHSAQAALLAIKQFDFDTALFPVNFVCILRGGFGPQIIAAAQNKKMGILALKGLARQPWPEGAARDEWPKCWYQPILDPVEAELSVRFTLSQPVTAAVPPGDKRLFRRALEIARRYGPLTADEDAKIRELASTLKPLFTA